MIEKNYTERILFWVPRALVIAFALFISLFAMDVFSEGYSLGEMMLALFMHLIPTFVIIIVLLLAWKWELFGGFAFIILGIAYIIITGLHFPLLAYVSISLPLFLTGALFLLHRYMTARKPA